MSPAEQPAALVTGIDVGATKTHLARGVSGVIVDETVLPTPSWRTWSTVDNARALATLVADSFGAETLNQPLAVGAHGCDSTADCNELADQLRQHFSAGVQVVNDAELTLSAAGHRRGIGVVVGTGSIAVSRDQSGELLTAGGWGWILGDEGSAAGIVREATRAVLARMDRGLQPDALTTRLLSAFEARDGAQLAMTLSRDSSAYLWGRHAQEVFHAADEGSAAAAMVIEQAGQALARLIDQLIDRGVDGHDVVAGGAVIVTQARLRHEFVDAVKAAHPHLKVSVLNEPPVLGALALAQSVADTSEPSLPTRLPMEESA